MYNVLKLLAPLFISFKSAFVWSSVDSKIRNSYIYQELTMPLVQNSLTVGRDLPSVSILYAQTFNLQSMYIDSLDNGSVYWLRVFGYIPLAKTNWNQNPYPNKVCETGVPGIDMAFYRGNSCPYTESSEVVSSSAFNLAD